MSKKVLISFSGRNTGNCARIAAFLSEQMEGAQSFRFSDFQIEPCGNCSCECLKGSVCPKNDMETALMNAVCSSDEAWFIVPNYCGFPCANLYIYNERSVGYFGGDRQRMEQYMAVPKRFVLIGNGSQENFRRAFEQHTNEVPKILQLQSREFQVSSIAGNLLNQPEVQNRLIQFLQA